MASSTSRTLLAVCSAIALSLPAAAWGWGGATHRYIARNYAKHLPPTMDGLRAYDAVVEAHVTDPDTRRPYTPGEASRHYIDIDAYPEFLAGALTHDRAALEAQYGASAVLDIGVLPWAVGEVVATLTAQFRNLQWSDAALTVADLCHYVGDATQPLHCTENYDGQFTGNDGIHSRYESTMMTTYIGQLSTPVMPCVYHANPVDALFGMVSGSWDEVDALLAADQVALAASGGAYNSVYYASLWNSTGPFTRTRIDSASAATASFVYTAWVDAGRPPVPGSSVGGPPAPVADSYLRAGPSPFQDALTIRYSGNGPLRVDVYDVRGTHVARPIDRAHGVGSVSWRPPGSVPPGLYWIRLSGPGQNLVKRVARVD